MHFVCSLSLLFVLLSLLPCVRVCISFVVELLFSLSCQSAEAPRPPQSPPQKHQPSDRPNVGSSTTLLKPATNNVPAQPQPRQHAACTFLSFEFYFRNLRSAELSFLGALLHCRAHSRAMAKTLAADPVKLEAFVTALPNDAKKRVGLSWAMAELEDEFAEGRLWP